MGNKGAKNAKALKKDPTELTEVIFQMENFA